MKLTNGVVTRDEVFAIAPDYVKYIEGDYDMPFTKVLKSFETLKRNQQVITYYDGQYIKAKISSIKHDTYQAIDGPVVRVSNGEASWRVDGNKYAYPIST